MSSQYTPDEAMDYRSQTDTAMEELTESAEHVLGPPADAEEVVPASPESSTTGAAPEAQGWWARLTRGLRHRS